VSTTADIKFIRQFLGKDTFSFPILIGSKKVARKYKVKSVPVTLVVDRQGRILFRHVGFKPEMEEVYVKEIEALLARMP